MSEGEEIEECEGMGRGDVIYIRVRYISYHGLYSIIPNKCLFTPSLHSKC